MFSEQMGEHMIQTIDFYILDAIQNLRCGFLDYNWIVQLWVVFSFPLPQLYFSDIAEGIFKTTKKEIGKE